MFSACDSQANDKYQTSQLLTWSQRQKKKTAIKYRSANENVYEGLKTMTKNKFLYKMSFLAHPDKQDELPTHLLFDHVFTVAIFYTYNSHFWYVVLNVCDSFIKCCRNICGRMHFKCSNYMFKTRRAAHPPAATESEKEE